MQTCTMPLLNCEFWMVACLSSEHTKLGRAVNFFAPAGTAKYWVKSSSPVFGYIFYYTLDMAICPYLASIFGMPIWHPTNEAEVDEPLNAGVQV